MRSHEKKRRKSRSKDECYGTELTDLSPLFATSRRLKQNAVQNYHQNVFPMPTYKVGRTQQQQQQQQQQLGKQHQQYPQLQEQDQFLDRFVDIQISVYRDIRTKKYSSTLDEITMINSYPEKIPKNPALEVYSIGMDQYEQIVTSQKDYVILAGVSGAGKSTLSARLWYLWGCNEIWSDEESDPYFRLVFNLSFHQLQPFMTDATVTAEKILSVIYPQLSVSIFKTNRTLMILDGVDVFLHKSEEEASKYNTNFNQAILDLLNPNNSTLPFARMVTVHPCNFSFLLKALRNFRIDKHLRLFEITGFTSGNIEKFFLKYLSEAKNDLAQLFLQNLQKNRLVKTLMKIPYYTRAVCSLLAKENTIDVIPSTYTGFFCLLLMNNLSERGLVADNTSFCDAVLTDAIRELILTLVHIAYQTETRQCETAFPMKQIFEDKLILDILDTGLVVKFERNEIGSSHHSESLYKFSSLIFQQLLAASHLFQNGFEKKSLMNYKMHTVSMVAGLAGGVVEDSKSDLLVQNYSKSLKGVNSVSILQLLSTQTFWDHRLLMSIMYEYHQYIHHQSDLTFYCVQDFKENKQYILSCDEMLYSTALMSRAAVILYVTCPVFFCGKVLEAFKIEESKKIEEKRMLFKKVVLFDSKYAFHVVNTLCEFTDTFEFFIKFTSHKTLLLHEIPRSNKNLRDNHLILNCSLAWPIALSELITLANTFKHVEIIYHCKQMDSLCYKWNESGETCQCHLSPSIKEYAEGVYTMLQKNDQEVTNVTFINT